MADIGVSSAEEYLTRASQLHPAIIVICAMGGGAWGENELAKLKAADCLVPVVLMSDCDRPELIMAALDKGANGFLPADISLEVAGHALRLVAAGGQYIPAACLTASRRPRDESQNMTSCTKRMFTRRQVAVIDALRKGKANKIIAYELNMCESTVKVHVRNIMKKLNAKNRTEVAYLANELLTDTQRL
jgi:DNA-binding NarL/FixJ family response regulator